MNLRVTFVLMVLFIVLGSFAMFDPFGLKEKQETARDMEKRVLQLREKKLFKIALTNEKGFVELECESLDGCVFDGSAKWKVVNPINDLGDNSAIATLASSALNLTFTGDFPLEEGMELGEFGLDKPVAVLSLTVLGEAEPYVVRVGKSAAIGQSIYVQTNRAPDKIYMVTAYFGEDLKNDLFHWRNKRIMLGVEPDQVESLYWYRSPPLEVEKSTGVWKLARPIIAPANQIMIDGLVNTAVFLAAKSVYADARDTAKAAAVLAKKPIRELRLTTKDKTTHKLYLYPPPPNKDKDVREFIARAGTRPELYIVDAVPFNRLDRDIIHYRDRALLPPESADQIAEITLKFPKEKKEITLVRREGVWDYGSGEKPAETLSQSRLIAFVDALHAVEASGYQRASDLLAKHERATPDVILELKLPKPVTYRFMLHERKVALVESDVRNELREFGEKFLRLLPVRFSDLYESSNKQVTIREEARPHESHDHHHGH